MLSEKLLEELVRNTALSQHLVEMAWPSLSTESRLQVIQAIQGNSMSNTPSWLATLALDDPAPVVRYLAARYTYFNSKGTEQYRDEWKFLAASDEDKALYAKASADCCQFVRFCVQKGTEDTYKHLSSVSQLERLLFIRHLEMPGLLSFIEWLEEANAAGVADSDLRDCAHEFFMLPNVQKDMKKSPTDFADGFDAYLSGEGIRRGWNLTKRAGPGLRMILSYSLPTSYGLGTMKVDELAELPDDVLSSFFSRVDPSEEIVGVLRLMHEQPDRFSPELQEKLKRHDENDNLLRWGPGELEEHRLLQAVNRQEAMLKAVLDLKRQLANLREYVQEAVADKTPKKRGFFS